MTGASACTAIFRALLFKVRPVSTQTAPCPVPRPPPTHPQRRQRSWQTAFLECGRIVPVVVPHWSDGRARLLPLLSCLVIKRLCCCNIRGADKVLMVALFSRATSIARLDMRFGCKVCGQQPLSSLGALPRFRSQGLPFVHPKALVDRRSKRLRIFALREPVCCMMFAHARQPLPGLREAT